MNAKRFMITGTHRLICHGENPESLTAKIAEKFRKGRKVKRPFFVAFAETFAPFAVKGFLRRISGR